jgi:hypothetical protein
MRVRPLIAVAVLLLATEGAYACLFATSTPPEGWYQWSSMLYAGDVAAVEKDVITVRVVETFKGPEAAGTGTLTVSLSTRYWTNCKVEKPAVGARVLVAMNANSEAMLVSLSAGLAEALRAHRKRGQEPFPKKGS